MQMTQKRELLELLDVLVDDAPTEEQQHRLGELLPRSPKALSGIFRASRRFECISTGAFLSRAGGEKISR
jgi:hypothetical protein